MREEMQKILIVTDDTPILTSLEGYLERDGFITNRATDSVLGWDLLGKFQPDIIFLDIVMLDQSGRKLLEKIQEKSNGEIPVIVLSEQKHIEITKTALHLGACDYITKPIHDLHRVRHAIDQALEKRYLSQQVREYQELFEIERKEKTQFIQQESKRRQQVEKQILTAKQQWEKTVDSLPDLIALYDNDHTILRLNKAMAEVMGVPVQEAVGKKFCMFNPECQTDFSCPHTQVVASGESKITEYVCSDSTTYYRVEVVPFKDKDRGTVIGTVLFAKDVTAEKKAQEQSKNLQAQLLHKQKLESVGQLAAGIAHEINTPTQYVATNLEFLEEAFSEMLGFLIQLQENFENESGQLPVKAKAMLDNVDLEYFQEEVPVAIKQSKDGVDKIRSIVGAMKEFSHPGSKTKEPHDINKIINTTVIVAKNEWKYIAEMVLELDSDLPHINCLADEIGQVLLNILVNAAHAITEKLGKNPEKKMGEIRITTFSSDHDAVVQIQDNGGGIPEKVKEKIFDPFFTTKEAGKGTGQGLAIAHNVIVQKHQGSVTVESEPGYGTTFTVKLPL